ncbi:hypothetical protein [Bdellovibrio bacteriovorus]|nr:hypothetical protein [Bdellovibrio bacteriovorus]
MMIFLVMLLSFLGAELTFFLIHRYHFPTVRASSGLTLVFAGFLALFNLPFVGVLQAAFFGATFVGMTDRSRMGWKRVFLASQIYGLIYFFLIPFARGFGGGLGAAAFVSIATVYSADKILRKARSSGIVKS